ncbi:hypothetical protein [Mucilaginibacter hurinus]|nr:hypothetical protein [Mucilaginibacter hurinus]
MQKISSQLVKQHYIITSQTGSAITFKDDMWQIRLKSKIYSKVDKGIIEIETSGTDTIIKYTYYISYIVEIVVLCIALTVSFMIRQYYVILFILPFLIQFAARTVTLPERVREMITTILE